MAESIQPAGADVFMDPWHRGIYQGIAATWRQHGHADAILLKAWMETPEGAAAGAPWVNPGSAEGSLADLVKLLNSVPSAAHGPAYGVVLLHLWRCRMTYTHAHALASAALARASVEDMMDSLIELNQIVDRTAIYIPRQVIM